MNIKKLNQTLFRWRAIPLFERVEKTLSSLSLTARIIFYAGSCLLILITGILLLKINSAFLVEIPRHGGMLEEGIIGSPRFINPVLALSDADRDLTSLIYSGLLKATPYGNLINDLAESFSVSDDGLLYTVVISDEARFHDGVAVTADDVVFTIQKALDPGLKSPKRPNWDGVGVEKTGDREVRFTLRQPYAPFLENLTLGILPKHIWKNTDADQFAFSNSNIEPIGSGPYKIQSVKKNSSGLPVFYHLVSFSGYILGEPYINDLIIRFYPDEKEASGALSGGSIESLNSVSPERATLLKQGGFDIHTSPLPRVFGIFFNQNQAPIFLHQEIRDALNLALDKERIIREVLFGYGTPIDSPIPPKLLPSSAEDSVSEDGDKDRARALLEKRGWSPNAETGIMEKKTKSKTEALSFSISTSDAPELKEAARIIQEEWSKIGVSVEIKVFESGDLNQNIIRPRKYDALLFGEIIGRDLDFFPFWHSSQRNDPGLNIALYANISVDKLLESARVIANKSDRNEKYQEFESIIKEETPVVFVYSPDFIYILPKKIKNVEAEQITIPAERFLAIHHWYIETRKVWEIFVPNYPLSQ